MQEGTVKRSAPARTSLARQRSHMLLVFSNATSGQDDALLHWYRNNYLSLISDNREVLSVEQYERHEYDITQGAFPRIPFRYLGLYNLSLDGAQSAGELIARIAALHATQSAAQPPASWLYYPTSEKVGDLLRESRSTLTVAFANGIPGQEAEFREWYATCHIRHALKITALVSGQCFQLTKFQRPGALEASFDTIAVYEQEGAIDEVIESFAAVSAEEVSFPTLDLSRFSESIYRPISL